MIINTTLIGVIWHQMMIKDFNMTKEAWKKRILFIFVILSAVIYPLLIIIIELSSTLYQVWFQAMAVIGYVVIITGCLIFYIFNLVRIVLRISRSSNISIEVKNRHMDKFIVVVSYIVLTFLVIISAYFYTILVNIICYSLILLIVNSNNVIFMYYLFNF